MFLRLSLARIVISVTCFCLLPAATHSVAAEIGDSAFAWQYLPGTDGQLHSLKDYKDAKLVVVAFMCNKCPCVKGYESRFKRLSEQYGSQGVRFVGINCSNGPVENMDVMKQRASTGNYNFDYLRDSSQRSGRGFRATTTPQVFILDQDRRVVYTGAFDNNRTETAVTQHYVVDAVKALLDGKPVPVARTRQFGCTITYAQ